VERIYDGDGEPAGYRQLAGVDFRSTKHREALSKLPEPPIEFSFKEAKHCGRQRLNFRLLTHAFERSKDQREDWIADVGAESAIAPLPFRINSSSASYGITLRLPRRTVLKRPSFANRRNVVFETLVTAAASLNETDNGKLGIKLASRVMRGNT
jgi:hypothetical protein